MALKFRRGTTAQKSGSLAFGEPFVNTDLGTLQIGGDTGDITLSSVGTGSNLVVGGISGSSLDITGNAKIDGNLSLGGQLTIGDNISDTVNVVASLSSSLIPSETSVFDLGSSTKIWRDLYISTGSIKFVEGDTVVKTLTAQTLTNLETATGSFASSISNLNTFTSSINTTIKVQLDTNTVVSGSSQVSYPNLNNIPSGIVSGSSQIVGILGPLNTYTASNDITNSTQNSRLDQLSTASGSAIGRLNNLESTSASVNISVSSLNNQTSSYVTVSGSQTINGTKTFNDIVVNGTGSFAYITSISGDAKIIGDAFIVLNTDTPTSRYAGISVYDSGSTLSTASFYFDAETNNWGYEYSSSTGVDYAVSLFGPEYNTKGNPTYLTANRVPKAADSHHLNDSNITDSGTLITLGSNTLVSGTLVASGTTLVSSSAQVVGILSSLNTYTSSNDITNSTQNSRLDQLSTASGSAITRLTNIESFTSSINTTIKTKLDAEGVISSSAQLTTTFDSRYLNTNGDGIVSGSSQIDVSSTTGDIALGTRTSGNYVATITAGTGVSSTGATTGEGITHTISIGQSVATSANAQFNSLGIGMAASATAGRIDATNDIVAYSSSDIRFKENIIPIENALDKISKISGNTYDWKTENKIEHGYEGNDVGVIAQEIEEVLPQLVQTRENGYKAVKYDKLVALLIEGIKEQQLQIEELKAKVGL